MHPFAEKASIAALAAARQNKYQELTRVLLDNYNKLNDETIKKHAEGIGLDMEKFNEASNDLSLKRHIQEDIQMGSSVKVRGVPALFINGRVVKERSIQGFSQMVEQELKKNR